MLILDGVTTKYGLFLHNYDWVMKFRIILMYNMKCPRIAIENDNRDLPLTKEYVLSDLGSGEKVHNKLGQYIPNSTRNKEVLGQRILGFSCIL